MRSSRAQRTCCSKADRGCPFRRFRNATSIAKQITLEQLKAGAAAREEIAVVVSDLYMPHMSGLEFADALTTLGLNRPVPRVLLLTARPSLVSKVNTVCQALFILAVVGRAKFAMPPEWVVTWLGGLVFVTVAVSGIDYILVYGRRAATA